MYLHLPSLVQIGLFIVTSESLDEVLYKRYIGLFVHYRYRGITMNSRPRPAVLSSVLTTPHPRHYHGIYYYSNTNTVESAGLSSILSPCKFLLQMCKSQGYLGPRRLSYWPIQAPPTEKCAKMHRFTHFLRILIFWEGEPSPETSPTSLHTTIIPQSDHLRAPVYTVMPLVITTTKYITCTMPGDNCLSWKGIL